MTFSQVSTFQYDIERMYPPVRNFTSHTTNVVGQNYGNGLCIVGPSSVYDTDRQGFSAFFTSIDSGPVFTLGNYTSGVYNKSLFIKPDYPGEWLKIKLPVGINLTRYSIKQRINDSRCPKDFKIYGSDDDINWVQLVHETNATYLSFFFVKSISTNNTYNHFALAVNKLYNNDNLLNFDEWYIYGKSVLLPEENQTTNSVVIPEQKEVQLLLLDSTKYIEAVPFNISAGFFQLIVGKSGSFSSFSDVTTGTNGITYGSGCVSNTTGSSITYNAPVVIVKYKHTNIVISQVQQTEFLKYTNADG